MLRQPNVSSAQRILPMRIGPLSFVAFLGLSAAACSSGAVSRLTEEMPQATESASQTSAPLPPSGTAINCSPTLANGRAPAPDYPHASEFTLGNAEGTIFTVPWPNGVVNFEKDGPGAVLPDGSLAMKFWWYRTVPGPMVLEGRRIDAPAPRMPQVTLHGPADGYGSVGFTPGALIFPGEGCWLVTATVGDHSLAFVTLVVKDPDLPIPTPQPADLHIRREMARYGLYPIPESCPIDPLTFREIRYRYTGWYWLGAGHFAAGTPVGLLFEGENPIQWQSYAEADVTIASQLLADPAIAGTVVSAVPVHPDGLTGQIMQTTVVFPQAGCWRLFGRAGDQILDVIVYVYPRTCRPDFLVEGETDTPDPSPCPP